MKTVAIAVIVVLCSNLTLQQGYRIPDAVVKVPGPKGITISIPDEPGIEWFAYYAYVNHGILNVFQAMTSVETDLAVNGWWTIHDDNIRLKLGDVFNYRLLVLHNRQIYFEGNRSFTVEEYEQSTLLEDTVVTPLPVCAASVTKINGGQSVCANTIIFEESFTGSNINSSKWTLEQYIPSIPDYEFNSYEKHAQNAYISNKNLFLKCTLREDPYLHVLDLTDGCTGKNCKAESVAGMIPPPVISGRIKSTFSFLYGTIEIRAQLPRGDWLFPEIYLEPKNHAYGAGYNSGRVWIAYSRGNADLKTVNNDQIGNNVLYSGPVLHSREPGRSYVAKTVQGNSWGLGFHTYILTWKPDGFTFMVDGVQQFNIRPPNGGFSSLKDSAKIPYASAWTSSIAPFDQEFVVILGIGAGGRSDFPDKCSSSGVPKPWKNSNTGAIVSMIKAKDQWFPTWGGDASALKVDYVKVTSL